MPITTANLTPLEKRQILIRALRAPMPKGFVWDFAYVHMPAPCGTLGCALGLAENIGLIDWVNDHESEVFGMTDDDVKTIFYQTETYGVVSAHDVTPSMVADALARLP